MPYVPESPGRMTGTGSSGAHWLQGQQAVDPATNLVKAQQNLERLQVEILALEREARQDAALAPQKKIAIGNRLLEAKALRYPHGSRVLKYGEFWRWAKRELGWGQNHVTRHMQLA
jgi:hypothetical protein